MQSNKKDLLELLKCKPYLTKDDMTTMKIKPDTLKDLCEEFGFKISMLKYGNEEYRFFNKDGVMVKNYTNLEVTDNGYWKFSMQTRCQEDLDKLYKRICADARKRNLVSDDIGICHERIEDYRLTNFTEEARFPDFKFKNKYKHLKARNAKSWSYWDSWRDMPEFIFNFKEYSFTKIQMYFRKKDYSLEQLMEIFEQSFGISPEDCWI